MQVAAKIFRKGTNVLPANFMGKDYIEHNVWIFPALSFCHAVYQRRQNFQDTLLRKLKGGRKNGES